MPNNSSNSSNTLSYYRFIALWVLCESMLGGIIHGFKIPVSGLIVGSCSVICISLIAYYTNGKGNILKATIIVAIFKMMLSPQAPPPAYIAVFFQGLLGELLFFNNKKLFGLSCMILAILSLLESGLQRVAVMTVVYGTDFWKALDDLIVKLTGQKHTVSYSLYFISVYTGVHLVAGIGVGWWCSKLPLNMARWKERYQIGPLAAGEEIKPEQKKRKRFFKRSVLLVWILLILVYLQSTFNIGKPLLSSHISLQIFVRSLLIITGWYLFVGPLLLRWMNKWLQKEKSKRRAEVQQVVMLLPGIKAMITESWKRSAVDKGIKRIVTFSRFVIVNIVEQSAE